MAIDVFSTVSDIQQEQIEKSSKLPYDEYLGYFVNSIKDKSEASCFTPSNFGGKPKQIVHSPEASKNNKFIVLKEPIEFMKLFQTCLTTSDADKKFTKLIDSKNSEVVSCIVDNVPQDDGFWFNTTKNGINLRPGLENCEKSKPSAVTLGDDAVHAIVAGRTGSGKSVFLNSLLENLMVEYSPWELSLFLADFKMVELSRYLSEYEVPHVRAVAATSEVRYVVSLMQYLVDCMKARQNFFKILGLQKIADLRNKYNVVLPRVLFLVDEFQQLFTEALGSEETLITDLLTSITKLGRATGFHLLFSSQEMTGTLGSSVFANFKARFALQCTEDVSAFILGNNAGAKLNRIGIIISNCRSSYEEDNVEYQVPFIDPDEGTYFNDFLKKICDKAEQLTFSTFHKFYQEDKILPFENFTEIENKITKHKSKLVNESSNLFEIFTLGESVMFNQKTYDYETAFIEKGNKKNLEIYSPDIDTVAYFCKLIAANICSSANNKNYIHKVFNNNNLILDKYNLIDDLKIDSESIFSGLDEVESISKIVLRREEIRLFINNIDPEDSVVDVACAAFELRAKQRGVKVDESVKAAILEICGDYESYSIADIPKLVDLTLSKYDMDRDYFYILELVYKVLIKKHSFDQVFPCYIVWVLGIDSENKINKDIALAFLKSTSNNVFFVFLGQDVDYMSFPQVDRSCDYVLTAGGNDKMYTRLKVPYTKRSSDSIAADFFVKSKTSLKSFKKFYFELNKSVVPEIDFDSILL